MKNIKDREKDSEEEDSETFYMEELEKIQEWNFPDYDDVSTTEEEEIEKASMCRRDRFYKMLTHPTWNRRALTYALVNFLAILLSTLTFMIGTLPSYHASTNPVLSGVETLVMIIFTFDYVARIILTRKNRFKWSMTFLNVVDLLAIIPFYIELCLQGSAGIKGLVILRVLRLLRVFRVLKIAKYSKQVPIIIKSLKASGILFAISLFSVALVVTLWASAIHFAEVSECVFDEAAVLWRYTDGEITDFQSIPHTLWYTIVTMTTVGYGDVFPMTALGKAVSSGAIVSGIFVLVFPITILAGNFQVERTKYLVEENLRLKYVEKKRRLKKKNVKQRALPSHVIIQNIWKELGGFRRGIETTQFKIAKFHERFSRLEIHVRKLRKHLKRQAQQDKSMKVKMS